MPSLAWIVSWLLLSCVFAANSSYVGYLISTFSDKNPTVQWYLSKGNDPGSYTFLNKGQPILRSTVGTKAVRDVFLVTNSARNEWFMICTGLFGCLSPQYRADTQLKTLMLLLRASHGTGPRGRAVEEWLSGNRRT